jgi:ubiquinone/menaquinone biosynthesis C-methylase UbiE
MQSTETVYDDIVSHYNKKVKSEMLDHCYIEKFLSLFESGDLILDVGAGIGAIAYEMMMLHRLKVMAIDISKKMVEFGNKKYLSLNYKEMDMRNLKFKNDYFKGIFANYSLIHILDDDVQTTLQGFNRVLKHKGYLYLSLQSPRQKKQRDGYYPLAYKKNKLLFINLINKKEIKAYLKNSGFKIIGLYERKPDMKMEFPFNKTFIIAQKIS